MKTHPEVTMRGGEGQLLLEKDCRTLKPTATQDGGTSPPPRHRQAWSGIARRSKGLRRRVSSPRCGGESERVAVFDAQDILVPALVGQCMTVAHIDRPRVVGEPAADLEVHDVGAAGV